MTMKDEKSPGEAAEAAATRRRWINLAEILAVGGLLISGLALWNAYQERTGEQAEKEAARREASAEAQTLLLRAVADREGERLSLAPADPAQVIQSQTVTFPSPLGVAPVETVIEPRIEARWFERALLRAREAAGEAGEGRGDARVPVAIATSFVRGSGTYRDTAIYDVGYRVEGGGLFSGRDIRLRGLSRAETAPARGAQARLDAIWRSRRPAPPAD